MFRTQTSPTERSFKLVRWPSERYIFSIWNCKFKAVNGINTTVNRISIRYLALLNKHAWHFPRLFVTVSSNLTQGQFTWQRANSQHMWKPDLCHEMSCITKKTHSRLGRGFIVSNLPLHSLLRAFVTWLQCLTQVLLMVFDVSILAQPFQY